MVKEKEMENMSEEDIENKKEEVNESSMFLLCVNFFLVLLF